MTVPIKKFKADLVEAAIWSNKKKMGDVETEFKTVSLSRSYKKKDEDMWRNEVIHMRRGDLQKAILVLQKAQEILLLESGKSELNQKIEEDENE